MALSRNSRIIAFLQTGFPSLKVRIKITLIGTRASIWNSRAYHHLTKQSADPDLKSSSQGIICRLFIVTRLGWCCGVLYIVWLMVFGYNLSEVLVIGSMRVIDQRKCYMKNALGAPVYNNARTDCCIILNAYIITY
jgi:hypothetical protein